MSEKPPVAKPIVAEVTLEDRLKEAEKKPLAIDPEDVGYLKTQALKGLMSELPEDRRVEVKKLIDESGMSFKQSIAMIEMARSLSKPTKPPAEKPTGGVPLGAVAGIEKRFSVIEFQKERDEKRKAKS